MSNTDINNLNLLDEIIEYKPEVESGGFAKIPDGTYLMTVTRGRFPAEAKKSSSGEAYLAVSVSGTIVDPGGKFDGRKVSGRASSMVFPDGTSMLTDLLKQVGTPAPPRCTLRDLQQLVENALDSQPQAYTRIRWEVRKQLADKSWERVRGMKNFPQNEDGTYSPFITIEDETLEAREEIVGFPTAKSAQKRQAGGQS